MKVNEQGTQTVAINSIGIIVTNISIILSLNKALLFLV